MWAPWTLLSGYSVPTSKVVWHRYTKRRLLVSMLPYIFNTVWRLVPVPLAPRHRIREIKWIRIKIIAIFIILCWRPTKHDMSHAIDSTSTSLGFVITRVSEVIMFSPCVFVCLCVCVYVCHDVCPDDLTMKDWCHTNNILQVYCWGCLVVQVMFHALMTSLMTSQDHKIGQILKLIYLRQYWARASIKSSKCRKCSWLSFWYIQLPV